MNTEEPKVLCSFPECQNSGKECWRCSFNGALRIGNYLVLKNKEGKIIKYLGTKSDE